MALNILAYNHAHAMLFFSPGGARTHRPEALSAWARAKVLLTGVNVPRPIGTAVPGALSPDCRAISIAVPDGVTLGAWYADRGADTPLVILFHGYAAEKTALLPEADTFLDLGMSVLLMDFRGSGTSLGEYTTIGYEEARDVAAAVRYARETLTHPVIVLFGQSMGAVAILRAVHALDVRPDAVIAEAVFDTMLNTVRNRFKAMGVPSFPSAELLVFWGGRQVGFNGFAHNPVTYAQSVECPILFMHGSNDPRATLEEGRRVFAAVPGAKMFKEFPSAGHESYAVRFPEEWKQTVSAFIEQVPSE